VNGAVADTSEQSSGELLGTEQWRTPLSRAVADSCEQKWRDPVDTVVKLRMIHGEEFRGVKSLVAASAVQRSLWVFLRRASP
jgi:hypothetical protein